MDIFFQDPSVIPLPPNEVRIKTLRAEPWPDNRRIRVYLEITPFQKRPSGEIILINSFGEETSSISIIETIDPKMEFTLHIRGQQPTGEFTVRATIFYLEEPRVAEGESELPPDQPERNIVDQSDISVQIGV